jgi:hypothetical protein
VYQANKVGRFPGDEVVQEITTVRRIAHACPGSAVCPDPHAAG